MLSLSIRAFSELLEFGVLKFVVVVSPYINDQKPPVFYWYKESNYPNKVYGGCYKIDLLFYNCI